jgi:hypothetical protein
VVLKTDADFEGAANDILHAVAMRLLASFPAGAAELMVIDPLDLWRDIAATAMEQFFDDPQPPVRVWTDAEEISAGVNNVIETLETHDEPATRRLLVVGSFPVGLAEEDVAGLMAIARGAALANISLLAAVDPANPVARDLVAALAPGVLVVRLEDNLPRIDDEVLGQFPLHFDHASEDVISGLLQSIGNSAFVPLIAPAAHSNGHLPQTGGVYAQQPHD